ncbi:hypothetical protein J6O86_06795 [bacterium]|nr:hypothetical protein [bacterium]
MPKVKKQVLYDMQTRYFDCSDTKSVMNAVLATLYDSDYSIEDFNTELGLIRVTKTLKASYTSKKRVAGWSVMLAAATAYTVFSYGAAAASMYSPTRRIATEMKDKTVVIDANVYISQVDENKFKVKFIPVEKVLQNADGFAFNQMAPVKVIRIYRPEPYDEFFSQVEAKLK